MDFCHASLQNITFLIEGQPYPTVPLDLQFDEAKKKDWTRGYYSNFQDEMRADEGLSFDYDEFAEGGYCLYAFRLGSPKVCYDSILPKR